MTIYMVTGQPRSGTSAMMEFLIAGGIPGFYSEPDSLSNAKEAAPDGYVIVPHGNFEATRAVKFPDSNDRCVKVICDAVQNTIRRALKSVESLNPWEREETNTTFKAAVMMRRPDEVSISRKRSGMVSEIKMSDAALIDWLQSDNLPENKAVTSVVCVNFADMINDPIKVGQKLKDDGWPVDPDKAATVIDPELYRNRCI